MFRFLLSVFFIIEIVLSVQVKIDPDNLKCIVCRKAIDELEEIIKNVDPKKMVEVGNYKLDSKGNIEQNKVPMYKSQVFLSEAVDDICSKMNDYVRVRYKNTGKIDVMKMMVNGGMNPDISKADFVTDEDLNKSLQFYCEEILGENEDFIVDTYAKRGHKMPDGKTNVCHNHIKICEDWMIPNEEDVDWDNDKEEQLKNLRGDNPYGWNNNPGLMEQDAGEFQMSDHEEL